MKKTVSILMSAIMVSALSTAAFAADSSTEFSYTYAPDPEYTVTIPAKITLQDGENVIPLEVSDSKNFAGGKLSVTVLQTVPNGNHLAVSRLSTKPGEEGWWTADEIRYDIVTANGEEILYDRDGGWDGENYVGKELAGFTQDGKKSYSLILDTKADTVPGEYGGFIEYGIEFIGA